jgi:hypothetical protein
MSGATVEDKWPRDNLAARSPRTVIYGIYAAAGKENRPVLNHFIIGDKKCAASLVGAYQDWHFRHAIYGIYARRPPNICASSSS